MRSYLKHLLDTADNSVIRRKHLIQMSRYGVYQPPSLKELMSLRHLLISTGCVSEVNCEDLIGLTKAECLMLLKKLQRIQLS